MKTSEAILTAALSISLAGCVVAGKPKTATPPAPQPVAAPAAAPAPPEPLSMPQTQVQLPPPQPVDPEALAPAPAPEPPPEPAPSGRTARPRPATPPRTEPAAAPSTPSAPPPPEPERGPVREVLAPNESKRLKDNADTLKHNVRAWLTPTRVRRLNPNTVARIEALLKASDEAEEKGEMREASDLADRAMIWLRELQSGK